MVSKQEQPTSFACRSVPPFRIAPHVAADLPAFAKAMAEGTIVIIADPALVARGLIAPLSAKLDEAGADVLLFDEIRGEPKQADLEAACRYVREAGAALIVAIGGGSVLDSAKIAACLAMSEQGPLDVAMGRRPLPRRAIPLICLPTTAGTGAEFSSTNIFADNTGRKIWIWDETTKPDLVLLDPVLTVSLPPDLTAWTGLDAFVHAFEAATNRSAHAGTDLYADAALTLIASSLARAVDDGQDLKARGDMLLGSAYAGIAIDNGGVAMAHNIAHALAAIAPVHHGFATALALELLLPWYIEVEASRYAAVAERLGLGADTSALPGWYTAWLDRLGVERCLPPAFDDVKRIDLVREMASLETAAMRQSTRRTVTDGDLERFADAVLALKRAERPQR